MASKALNQMIFDAHWEEIYFIVDRLPPGKLGIHLRYYASHAGYGGLLSF